ncbi:MAG: hypothetical protein WCO56_09080 [Verrucomicrobiota bacterium]
MEYTKDENELITVVLKDTANNDYLFREHITFDDTTGAIIAFFDQHFQLFTEVSSKNFIIYVKSKSNSPQFFTVKLVVGECIEGDGEDEIRVPYSLDFSKLNPLEDSAVFPEPGSPVFAMRVQDNGKIQWELVAPDKKPATRSVRQTECTDRSRSVENKKKIGSSYRYYVAKDQKTEWICCCRLEEVAALLNAGKIQEDYLTLQTGHDLQPFERTAKDPKAQWVTVSQLLKVAYADKPLVTVIIKDVPDNKILLAERYYSDASPQSVIYGVMDLYFDIHYKEFAQTPPRAFSVYFKSSERPPIVVDFRLIVENKTVYREVIGSMYAPHEEHFPYHYNDGPLRNVEPPDEFPTVPIEQNPPKYDPSAVLPP